MTVPPSAEYVARNAANLAWLRESFGLTRARNVEAVMIIIQANPNFELPATDARRSGFNDFLAALESETIAFGKPVVLVHGDSHYFRIDKPMIGTRSRRRVENFYGISTLIVIAAAQYAGTDVIFGSARTPFSKSCCRKGGHSASGGIAAISVSGITRGRPARRSV